MKLFFIIRYNVYNGSSSNDSLFGLINGVEEGKGFLILCLPQRTDANIIILKIYGVFWSVPFSYFLLLFFTTIFSLGFVFIIILLLAIVLFDLFYSFLSFPFFCVWVCLFSSKHSTWLFMFAEYAYSLPFILPVSFALSRKNVAEE